jgi:hypothetical protein
LWRLSTTWLAKLFSSTCNRGLKTSGLHELGLPLPNV